MSQNELYGWLLDNKGSYSMREIVSRSGISRSSVYRCVNQLIRFGFVKREVGTDGINYYSLGDAKR